MAGKKKIVKEPVLDKKIKKFAPFLIWLGILVVVFIILNIIFQGLGKIDYNGLTFTKEKYGEVIIYHYYYLTKLSNGHVRKIDVLLRGNPAENNVPMNGTIIYPEGKAVYISINNTGLNECNYSMIALSSLDIFLKNNNIAVKYGTPDRQEAQTKNQTYITCGAYPNNMVISLKSGNESKIENVGRLCYNTEVANCEILPVLEKFILQSLVDAKEIGD